jgi:hypothetical protein
MHANKSALHMGALVFIHRLATRLNARMHCPGCVLGGVFEAQAGEQAERKKAR